MNTYVRQMTVAGTGFSSRLIEWRSDDWSHTATVLPDGSILDSRSDVVAASRQGEYFPAGVQIRPRGYLDGEPKWVLIEIPCTSEQRERFHEIALSQVGKPYDFAGIWQFITGGIKDRNWRDESAWYCTELHVWALEQAGICTPLATPVFKLDPGDGVLLAQALGGQIVASHGLSGNI
jgi:uncharacterized protein YycO